MIISLNDAPKFEALEYSGTQGLYSAVQPDDAGRDWLAQLCTDRLGFTDVKPSKFHCTVMYSPDEAPAPAKVQVDPEKMYYGVARKVIHWKGHDDATCVVLSLIAVDLHAEHRRLKKLGCKASYPTYKPHITLQSGVEVDDELQNRIDEVNAELRKDPRNVLVLSGQFASDIDP